MISNQPFQSKQDTREAYVWIWLPNQTQPVIAGRLVQRNDHYIFNYAQSYLAHMHDELPSIAIYNPELPLKRGPLPLLEGLSMPNCIRDGSPDAWGRRVIINKLLGKQGPRTDTTDLDEITYLLASGSDRIGALDFQASPAEYIPRLPEPASLEMIQSAVEQVQTGMVVTAEFQKALYHGTSIGGARPKALIESDHTKYIAKFSTSQDLFDNIKAEYIAMRLASLSGLQVSPVKYLTVNNKSVLLVERFDRAKIDDQWTRKAIVSGLTLLGLDEMLARYASYEHLAEIIRLRFVKPKETLKELFSRLVFNILCGNTDDHARNHAAFWDGTHLRLTPAYDICPQNRTGGEASQAMLITGQLNLSQLKSCLMAAHHFLITKNEAIQIFEHQISVIESHWEKLAEEVNLTDVDRKLLWRRQFLNPYSLQVE